MNAPSRRALLKAGMAMGLTTLAAVDRSHAQSSHVLVTTTAGEVAGADTGSVCIFKGIPYGASTAGEGRFRPPRKPAAWSGVLDTRRDPAISPQRDPRPHKAVERANPFAGIDLDWPVLPESEDCLKLDVWTPSVNDKARRPVLVWFHGGGFVAGSAAGMWQDGSALAAHGDIVMVSPNHRLNALGYTYLDSLDTRFAGAGNAGMLDLVLALQWVRDNIERFGGDPGNVTIMGQSGGGQKVCMLMAMPEAQGLFHKAIVESGPAPKALDPDYAKDMALRLISKLGVGVGELSHLSEIPVDRIMAAYFDVFDQTGGYGILGILQGFAPVVDGTILPKHPFMNGAPNISAEIPLLIGTTRTEMTLVTLDSDPVANRMDADLLVNKLRNRFHDQTEKVVAAYRAHHPNCSPWELYALITADWPTRMYSIHIAEQKAKQHRAPVFMYRTDWRTPVAGGILFSPHAIDIGFVLDDTRYTSRFDGGGPGPKAMARQMSEAWLAFARRGIPETPVLPNWPRYEPQAARATMLFDLKSRIASDPDGADRQIIAAFMERQ